MSHIYPRLLIGEIFSGSERETLTVFVAAQFLRLPAMLTSAANFYGDMVDKTAKFMADRDASIDERAKEFLLKKNAFTINIDAKTRLISLDFIFDISKVLFNYGWGVITTTGIDFISGDSPVFQCAKPENNHSPYGNGGFAGKGSRVTFPLSFNKLLFGELGMSDVNGIAEMKVQDGKLFNKQRAIASSRFLYANCQSAGIAKLGEKYFKEDQLLFKSSPVKITK